MKTRRQSVAAGAIPGARLLAGCACLLALIFSPALPLRAQERDTIIFWGDYDTFTVADAAQGHRACEQACARDPRCAAWTYISAQRQCRLKHAVGRREANSCCISGIKGERKADNREARCAAFADEGVKAVDDNAANACGFLGPRWQLDYDAHYRWCLRSEAADVEAESSQRTAELKRCLAARANPKGRETLCRHYSRTATVEVQSNAKARCGLSGERWASDPKAHYDWCLAANLSSIRDETEAREQELARCFAAVADRGMDRGCETYAEEAVTQYRTSLASQCGFDEGTRWNASLRTHYRWCESASAADRRRESDLRSDELGRCTLQQTSNAECREFAQIALQQAQSGRENGCGLRGADWSESEREHVQRCLAMAPGTRRQAQEARRDELQRCIALRNESPRCRQFAQVAVRLSEVNEAQGCELARSPQGRERWSADFARQLQWCRAQPANVTRSEIAERYREIVRCARNSGFELPPDLSPR